MSNKTAIFFTELNKKIKEDEHEEILEILNKILKETPNDVQVKKSKVVSLIQSGEYSGALKYLQENNKDLKLPLEEAYCQFRLGNFNDSLKILESLSKSDSESLFGLNLRGQVYYKSDKYKESINCYKKVLELYPDYNDSEFLSNYAASLILNEDYSDALTLLKKIEKKSFEMLYNLSCAQLGLNNIVDSEKSLKEAILLCKKVCKDDEFSEEEIQDEIAIFEVQLAYLNQKLGNSTTALEIYKNILGQKISDKVSLAIAANNICTISSKENVFETSKKLKKSSAKKVFEKFSAKQKDIVNLNKSLLLMLMGKFKECREVVDELQKKYPNSEGPPRVIASLNYREKKFQEALDVLKDFIKKNPENSLKSSLTLSQMQLAKGNVKESIEVLESIKSIENELSVVGALCSMYLKLNNPKKCIEILDNSSSYWLKKYNSGDKSVGKKLSSLLEESANLNIKLKEYKAAAKNLKDLVEINPEKKHIANLVICLSYFDIDESENWSKKLDEFDDKSVDAKKLESENISGLKSTLTKSNLDNDLDKKDEEKEVKKEKKKKKKKKKGKRNLEIEKLWKPKEKVTKNKMRGAQGSTSEQEQKKYESKATDKAKLKSVILKKNLKKRRGAK